MILKNWKDLPSEMQNDEVKKYYIILQKKKISFIFKRIFDIVLSAILIILLSPMFFIISIVIKFDSKGPVFFRQVRVTQYGKHFRIFKFRTMVTNPENIGSQVTIKNDLRITRIGSFIRRYRFDETAQLIDIFRGTMTFVGTRPEVPKYVERYSSEMMATILLPAGVTSIASIVYKDEENFFVGEEDLDEFYLHQILPSKMQYNLKAIAKFGVIEDIKIMLMTIAVVLGKEYSDLHSITDSIE